MEECRTGIIDQCDTKVDLIKYMYVSDLYFTVSDVFNIFKNI